jgi:phosphoribosylaminoimidazole carboxylase
MAHITVTADEFSVLASRVEAIGISSAVHKLILPGPLVGIIMGSDSDLPSMRAAAEVLEQFGVSFELTIVSAHRTPTRMYEYATSAVSRGLKVIIAGAGGAAHLPGMVLLIIII